MALTIVIDETDSPAAFGRAAAALAAAAGARLLHPPARFDLARDADAAQYVFPAGGLGPSGLHFAEALLGRAPEPAAAPEAIVAAAGSEEVVAALHPRFGHDPAALVALAEGAGLSPRIVRPAAGAWPQEPAAGEGPPLVVAFLGRERDHREVYPAALAALEAAARREGAALTVRFVDPERLADPAGAGALLDGAAGILLPGGADMANVAGQIQAARWAIDRPVPVLGLCLGMQTMATALAQRLLGTAGVNLAEADPAAPIKSFEAMAAAEPDLPPLPEHRTGDALVPVAPETRLAAILGGPLLRVRCNHRYRLAPALLPVLERGGLVVAAASFDDRVVDAVELPAHPFFLGLQGHPELGAPAGRPHPVFAAFLAAARRHASEAMEPTRWTSD